MQNYDVFGVTDKSAKEQVFRYSGNWVIWNKPKNVTMVYFLVIGPGAGGGGGYSGGGGTNRSGGGGGGSGGIVRASCPAYLLPNQLYIYVGKGGLGGTVGNPGASGELSYISVLSNNTSGTNLLLVSGAAAPTGGGIGSSGTNSTAGAGSTIMATGNAILSTWLNFTPIAGVAGAVGPIGSAGDSVTALASSFLTGGPAGGGIDSANATKVGGSITGIANIVPTVAGGAAGGATGGDGSGGYSDSNGLIFTAGSGAGSGTTTGGNASSSAIGCGGAGAGAGGTTGGKGGDGGNGLIVITAV